MLKNQKLLFIGGGAMGSAILRGVLETGAAQAGQISVVEPVADRRRQLEESWGLTCHADIEDAPGDQDVAVLCLKPQVFQQIGQSLGRRLHADTLSISIMAGTTLGQLSESTGLAKCVRAMPNTPAQVLSGMTVWTCTPHVTATEKESVADLFDAVGRHLYTEHEENLDKATAINGSGPGFVLLMMEAMMDAGVHVGFSRPEAEMLAVETFYGTARLLRERPSVHAAVQRNNVTSPAGTTSAGLLALEEAGVRAALIRAVYAAYERSKSLGT